MLSQGEPAPSFLLPDQENQGHRLSDYLGSWVLVYFYPMDDTPGCTKEACALRDEALAYEKNDIVVLGISRDSSESHSSFISKYKLPFVLLSDTTGAVVSMYGADDGKRAKRISYLIDPDGIIAKVYSKVDPESHAQEVLEDVARLA